MRTIHVCGEYLIGEKDSESGKVLNLYLTNSVKLAVLSSILDNIETCKDSSSKIKSVIDYITSQFGEKFKYIS